MMLKRSLIALLFFPYALVMADDTELFISDIAAENKIKPQVLIIFDTSGSMTTNEASYSEPYDPSFNYVSDSSDTDKVYWSTNSTVPATNSSNYYSSNHNNCAASIEPLSKNGLYSGLIRHWVVKSNNKNNWYTVGSNVDSTDIYDCYEDVYNSNNSNPGTPNDLGYPVYGSYGPYTSYSNNYVFTGGESATLYSANYLYWRETSLISENSRIAIAKDAITQLIESTPSVDFGLVVFNQNNQGGRLLEKIEARDSLQELVSTVNSLNANGGTPLCESMYEAYLYMGGRAIKYAEPYDSRDISAENNKVYISPFKQCQEMAYIILMTDGEPTVDDNADSLVSTLTGKNTKVEGSYLPVLTEWMNKNDIDGNTSNGNQYITTYTIGFGQDAVDSAGQLLLKTAELGGGEYFPATSSDTLQSAFTSTILEILNSSSSLSSPALATNNFDRTRSLDSIYYSMFLPNKKAVWKGNIKKLSMNNQGVIVDRNGNSAIDEDGNIKETASTYWGGNEDGNTVAEGGVSQMLNNMQSNTRKILSDIDATTTSALIEPNKANLKTYYNVADDIALATELEIESSELTNSLNWLKGQDVDDLDTDASSVDNRSDIFGDPLHSKPLTITYVETSDDQQTSEQIVRLLVGTNAGFLHMFTDNGDTVTENWAFIPEQLLKSSLRLRDNAESSVHHYGMDLSPIAIKIYESGSVQQIIAIIGMRRGGNSYFALDITDADNPRLLWKISNQSIGFEELAQTWSIPSVGMFLYKIGDTEIKVPGLVFGGGYDTNKDTCEPSVDELCNDTTGRAVYIVNAVTGNKIWSVDGVGCTDTDLHCLRDSIPSAVSLLDSDGDQYIDRIYVGDMGANLWRMDLVGLNTNYWSHIKLAKLGGDTAASNRQFFTAPVIVNTFENNVTALDGDAYSYKKTAYDGLLLGSGDRAHPASDITTNNTFYNIHDYNINPTLFGSGEGEVAKPSPLVESSLYDISNDPVTNYSGAQKLSIFSTMSSFSGWKYHLSDLGEKSLGQGTVLNGTVYFTSFVPNSTVNLTCGIGDIGTGWLYAVNLHTGANYFKNENGAPVTRLDIGSQVPDSLVIHSGVDTLGNSALRLLGVGQGDTMIINEGTIDAEEVNMGTMDTQTDMMPRRIYSFFAEK